MRGCGVDEEWYRGYGSRYEGSRGDGSVVEGFRYDVGGEIDASLGLEGGCEGVDDDLEVS